MITILALDDTSTTTISTLLASCPHFDQHHLNNLVSYTFVDTSMGTIFVLCDILTINLDSGSPFDDHNLGDPRFMLDDTSTSIILVLDNTLTTSISTLLALCSHLTEHHLTSHCLVVDDISTRPSSCSTTT